MADESTETTKHQVDEELAEEQGGLTLGGVFSRRAALRAGGLGAAGLVAAALIGCDDDDDDDATATATEAMGTATAEGAGTEFGTQEYRDFVAAQNANWEAEGAWYPYHRVEPDKLPKRGGTMRGVYALNITGTLDPNQTSSLDANHINGFCSNKLVGLQLGPWLDKYQMKLQPELAHSWEISEDGLTYTFNLRDDVKWQNIDPLNGRLMTAEDIALALQRFQTSNINAVYYEYADTIDAVDDHTVVVQMKQPEGNFLQYQAVRGVSIYPPEVYDQDLINNGKPIGSGPGILESAEPDVGYKIKSNPDYWRHVPYLDGFELTSMPDPAARLAAFRAGQADYYTPAVQDQKPLLESNPGVIIEEDPPGAFASPIFLNIRHDVLKDIRVRRALSLSADHPKAEELIYQGHAWTVAQFPWPDLFDSLPGPEAYGRWWQQDLDEAHKLIAASGQEGFEFDFVPSFGRATPAHELYAEFFRAIGVTMHPVSVDSVVWQGLIYGGEFKSSGDTAAAGGSQSTISPLGHWYDGVHSKSGRNQAGIDDPEIDQWAEQQRAEFDPDVQKEIRQKIFDRVLDTVYYVSNPTAFQASAYQPWMRWISFSGPVLWTHQAHDPGRGYEFYWHDK